MEALESLKFPVGFEVQSEYLINDVRKTQKEKLEKMLNNEKKLQNEKVIKLKNADAYRLNVKVAKSDPIKPKLSPRNMIKGLGLGEDSIFASPQRKVSMKKFDFKLPKNPKTTYIKRSLSPLNLTLLSESHDQVGMPSVKLPPLSRQITQKSTNAQVEVKRFVFNTKDFGPNLNPTEDEPSRDPKINIKNSSANMLRLFQKNVPPHPEHSVKKEVSSPRYLGTKPDAENPLMSVGQPFDQLALFAKKYNSAAPLNVLENPLFPKNKQIKLVNMNERKSLEPLGKKSSKKPVKLNVNVLKSVSVVENSIQNEPFNFKTTPLIRNGEFSSEFSSVLKINQNKQGSDSVETEGSNHLDTETDGENGLRLQKKGSRPTKRTAATHVETKEVKNPQSKTRENSEDDYDLREYLNNQRGSVETGNQIK